MTTRFSVERRLYCKNAPVCRESYHPNYVDGVPSYLRAGLCINCDVCIRGALDIAEVTDEECPVCYAPMPLGVKWHPECLHRFCPACFFQMLWGRPRPTYETYYCRFQSERSGTDSFVCYLHDDGSMVLELPEDTVVIPADGGPAPVTQQPEDDDEDEEPEVRQSCPICLRRLSGQAA